MPRDNDCHGISAGICDNDGKWVTTRGCHLNGLVILAERSGCGGQGYEYDDYSDYIVYFHYLFGFVVV